MPAFSIDNFSLTSGWGLGLLIIGGLFNAFVVFTFYLFMKKDKQ